MKIEAPLKYQLTSKLDFSKKYSLQILDVFYNRLSAQSILCYENELQVIEKQLSSQLSELDSNKIALKLFMTLLRKRKASRALDWKMILNQLLKGAKRPTNKEFKMCLKKLQNHVRTIK